MRTTRLLLSCGVLSPLLYASADLLAGISYPGYSFRDQTISELAAVGAPSRALFTALLIAVYALLIAFGVGVLRAAAGRRALRTAGALIAALGVMAVTVGQFVPMQPRGAEQGLSGLLHLLEGGVAVAIIVTAIAFAAYALDRPLRFFSIATIAAVLAFGAWSGMDVPRVEAGLATPWLGVKERVFWYAHQLWFAVLAVTLLRHRVN